MANGIRDRVAIIGMGCTVFGERWDKGADDLMVEAFEEAIADAGIERSRIEAAWVGNALDDINVGNSALPLAPALRARRCTRWPLRSQRRNTVSDRWWPEVLRPPGRASGLRMAYEVYTQLLGRAGERQLSSSDFGLTHNLGETPYNSVAAVSILGRLG
jgi:acetyl-CoA acetyltransferase